MENGTGIDPSKGYFTLYKLKPDNNLYICISGSVPRRQPGVMGADIHLTHGRRIQS